MYIRALNSTKYQKNVIYVSVLSATAMFASLHLTAPNG